MSGEFPPDDVINQLKSWYKKIGAPVTLKEVGINKEDIEKITQLANKHAPFGTVKELKMEDIRKIYEIAYE